MTRYCVLLSFTGPNANVPPKSAEPKVGRMGNKYSAGGLVGVKVKGTSPASTP